MVFELRVSPQTVPLQSVMAHLTTALKQVACLLTGYVRLHHALS
jgi:hypothetical protein